MLSSGDLRDVDERLLDYLREGRVTPAHARERVMSDDGEEYSRGYVQQRLSRLEEHGHATNLGGGLYELVDDPRDDVGQEDAVAELKEHVRAAGEAIDDQDIDALRRHVRAACEVLDDERD
jgi:hypothetical protein